VKRRSIFGVVLAAVASLALAGSSLAFAGIGNGSFENGTITPTYAGYDFQRLSAGDTQLAPWSVTGSVDWIGTYWQAKDGTQSVDLDGAEGDNGAISTTFATTIGNTYFVDFWLSANPDAGPLTKTGTVQVTGGLLTPFSYTLDIYNNSTTNMLYVEQGYSFMATSTSTTLTFASTTFPAGYGPVIDNVSVTQVATTGASCKNGGWATNLYKDATGNTLTFKNQGQCVSYFATSGAVPIGN
jgi:choice-of-anchor C domain-containing protein